MIDHYLQSAFRMIRRTPFTSAVNVFALALGFVCFIAAIGISRYWAMSDRHFDKADRILVITQQFGEGRQVSGFRPLIASPIATYLAVDFPMLDAVARIGNKRDWTVTAEDRKAALTGARADADLLKIFDFEFVEGQAASALTTSGSVILTRSAARKLFGDAPAVGQQINVGGEFYPTVAAVIESPPRPSHMSDDRNSFGRFDFLYGWPADNGGKEWWLGVGAVTYVLLPENKSVLTADSFAAQLAGFIERRLPSDQAALTKTEINVLPLSGLQARLIDLQLFEGNDNKLSIQTILAALGLAVLIVACINYANLATAQAVGTAREVGMRKVIGADSLQILLQHWVEALVLTIAAAAIALIGVWLLAPVLSAHIGVDMRLGLFDDLTPVMVVFCLVFVVALLACAYPVAFLAGVQPINAIRQGGIKAGPRLGSRILVTIQFLTASSLLIILLVIDRQNDYLRESSTNVSDHDVVLLLDDGSRTVGYEALGNDLANNPSVVGTSHLDYIPWSAHENFLPITRETDGHDDGETVFYSQIGYRFFELFGAELLAGRFFDEARNETGGSVMFGGATPATEVSVIIDRALTEALGYDTPSSAVGTELFLTRQFRENFSTNPTLSIVGVVENTPMVLAASGTIANLYVLADVSYGYPIVFLDRNRTAEGLDAISSAVVARNSDALVATQFMDEAFTAGFRTFDAINSAFAALSLIALTISLLGLVGMAAFTTSRRRHEIGVRKTLGSTVTEIVLLLLKDFSRPVIIGNLLAWPIAYLGVNLYLDNFITRVDLNVWPWVASFLITNIIATIAVSGQSYAAARVPPSQVLRYE